MRRALGSDIPCSILQVCHGDGMIDVLHVQYGCASFLYNPARPAFTSDCLDALLAPLTFPRRQEDAGDKEQIGNGGESSKACRGHGG